MPCCPASSRTLRSPCLPAERLLPSGHCNRAETSCYCDGCAETQLVRHAFSIHIFVLTLSSFLLSPFRLFSLSFSPVFSAPSFRPSLLFFSALSPSLLLLYLCCNFLRPHQNVVVASSCVVLWDVSYLISSSRVALHPLAVYGFCVTCCVMASESRIALWQLLEGEFYILVASASRVELWNLGGQCPMPDRARRHQ